MDDRLSEVIKFLLIEGMSVSVKIGADAPEEFDTVSFKKPYIGDIAFRFILDVAKANGFELQFVDNHQHLSTFQLIRPHASEGQS